MKIPPLPGNPSPPPPPDRLHVDGAKGDPPRRKAGGANPAAGEGPDPGHDGADSAEGQLISLLYGDSFERNEVYAFVTVAPRTTVDKAKQSEKEREPNDQDRRGGSRGERGERGEGGEGGEGGQGSGEDAFEVTEPRLLRYLDPSRPSAPADPVTSPRLPVAKDVIRAKQLRYAPVQSSRKWWQEAVIYQIYPRSFYDSNGDGVGDLRGIISKLDYLRDLGVDALWLCPVYSSPNLDHGYDVQDYQAINHEFGSMEDWCALRDAAHERGMKLIMDFMLNHTSDQHRWFQRSRIGDPEYRDFYIWRPPVDGDPPNNWNAHFGGSAWTLDEVRGEFYLHLFSSQMPDLNWENPRVRKAIYDTMRFWLDLGIDGFRIGAISYIAKAPGLPDAPETESERRPRGRELFNSLPRVNDFLREMNRRVLSKYDALSVGEMPGISPEEGAIYSGFSRSELDTFFYFGHVEVDEGPGGKWDPKPWSLVEMKRELTAWHTVRSGFGWNTIYFNNHDQPRVVSRFGDDGAHRVKSAKLFATLTLTLHAIPFLYQGEEIGMTNVAFDSIEDYRDIETLHFYREQIQAGRSHDEIMKTIHDRSRDNARTVMQWDDSEHGGFTSGSPWIKVNPNYRDINVKRALDDEGSVLHYYRALIALRRRMDVLIDGDYELLAPDDPYVYAYLRSSSDEVVLVVLNVSPEARRFPLPASVRPDSLVPLLANYPVTSEDEKKSLALRPFEARIYRVRKAL